MADIDPFVINLLEGKDPPFIGFIDEHGAYIFVAKLRPITSVGVKTIYFSADTSANKALHF